MKSIILLSGGIDSTVLLADRIHNGDEITPITFDYGQTHHKELHAAHNITKHYKIEHRHRIIELPHIFGESALLGDTDIPNTHADQPDTTTVPGRNLVMLAVAAAFAASNHTPVVFIGTNHDDWNGYVDCRPKFIHALDDAIGLGTPNGVHINARFQAWTKTDIIRYGHQLNAPLHLTWSCYRGGSEQCGQCGACQSNQTRGAVIV